MANGGGGRGGPRGGDAGPPGGEAVASDPGGGLSLFDAVSKQLGLKLDMQKRPLPVLVIDRAWSRSPRITKDFGNHCPCAWLNAPGIALPANSESEPDNLVSY
jgi:hypothetical protein